MHCWALWALLQLAIEGKLPVKEARQSQYIHENTENQCSSSQEKHSSAIDSFLIGI